MRSVLAFASWGALAGLFAQKARAQMLTKPEITPGIPGMDPGLFNSLNPVQSTLHQWEWGWIPLRCHDTAITEGLSPYDIEVYDVTYSDCPNAWVFCRHHASPMDITSMRDVFGRVPVRTRQWVRTLIGLPGNRQGLTYVDLGDTILWGDAHKALTLFIHEFGHIMDYHAVNGFNNTFFSDSQIWLDNYNMDPKISDGYAATNQHENFAQETVIGLFDKVVPLGLGGIEPNWHDIFHQYATVQGFLGQNIIPGGTCEHRWPNDGIECMGPAAPCGSSKNKRVVPHKTPANDTVPLLTPIVDSSLSPTKCDFSG
ncbi:hypothetical protein GQ53DRAFT_763832 [Thozetella sp. PMI_491]|nr:hypothetical protein GQ53DRAFT_763832 [Thozetella sp. PMI_491]